MANIDVVEHDTEDVAADIDRGLLDAREHRAGKTAVLHDDNGQVQGADQNRGIADPEDGR